MEIYQDFKNRIGAIERRLQESLTAAQSVSGLGGQRLTEWAQTCTGIRRQLSEETIRVAVVGAIKSGKSTFANALLGGDYLKRGAGVVTSIITRIRPGDTLSARLRFKSWDEVNADMRGAMVLLPSLDVAAESAGFDIRRADDRASLQTALDRLSPDQLISGDGRNGDSLLLSSYLKGYAAAKAHVSSQGSLREFDRAHFAQHREFVGNDALAVYLQDVCLTIDGERWDPSVEFADCQGSDSPNPLHLAMIQDHLVLTHLIVYVISSRTGLRQADIKFLSIIKRMGIDGNMLFVLNCDFNEHESLDELQQLLARVGEELALIAPDPQIFALSALFNLLGSQTDPLSDRNRLRLEQWRKEKELIAFSDRESDRFQAAFQHKLTHERYLLLLKNHIERLGMIADGLVRRISVTRDLLSRDAGSFQTVVDRIEGQQAKIAQVQDMIKSTLDGAVQKLKKELHTDIDRFFDVRAGKVLPGIVGFVQAYGVAYPGDEPETGFNQLLYRVYQEFKQALDSFMAETVNPDIARFIRRTEERIQRYFEPIAGSFDHMVQGALKEYDQALDSYGLAPLGATLKTMQLADLEALKGVNGLCLPPAAATLAYSTRIKTEAVMHLGSVP